MKSINTYKFYPEYHGNGSISIFQSLIVNLEKINKVYNIYGLGNHTKQKQKFQNLYKDFNFKYKEEYFNINHMEDCCCIYIKHLFNHSSYSNGALNKKWHRINIKIKENKKWFINRFDNFLGDQKIKATKFNKLLKLIYYPIIYFKEIF